MFQCSSKKEELLTTKQPAKTPPTQKDLEAFYQELENILESQLPVAEKFIAAMLKSALTQEIHKRMTKSNNWFPSHIGLFNKII